MKQNSSVRKLFAVLTALLFPAALFGQTHILFTLSDFNASPTTNRNTTVQKLQPFHGNLVTYSSGASGTFYVSNATVGDYDCVILKKGSASEIAFQVTVTATNLGVISAYTNTSVRGIQSYPTSGKSAWTILSSDARYSTNGGSSGSATNVDLAPGSARITIVTNADGNWTIDVPAGVTNELDIAIRADIPSTNGLAQSEIVNVRDYGAVPWLATNITQFSYPTNRYSMPDNSSAIQAAFNAAYASNGRSNTVFFPQGVWQSGSNIYVPPGINVRGVGVLHAGDFGSSPNRLDTNAFSILWFTNSSYSSLVFSNLNTKGSQMSFLEVNGYTNPLAYAKYDTVNSMATNTSANLANGPGIFLGAPSVTDWATTAAAGEGYSGDFQSFNSSVVGFKLGVRSTANSVNHFRLHMISCDIGYATSPLCCGADQTIFNNCSVAERSEGIGYDFFDNGAARGIVSLSPSDYQIGTWMRGTNFVITVQGGNIEMSAPSTRTNFIEAWGSSTIINMTGTRIDFYGATLIDFKEPDTYSIGGGLHGCRIQNIDSFDSSTIGAGIPSSYPVLLRTSIYDNNSFRVTGGGSEGWHVTVGDYPARTPYDAFPLTAGQPVFAPGQMQPHAFSAFAWDNNNILSAYGVPWILKNGNNPDTVEAYFSESLTGPLVHKRQIWGDGSTATDAAAPNRITLDALTISTGGVITNGAVIIVVTNATPTYAAPNGSLALVSDGRLYMRTNGAWSIFGGGGGGDLLAANNLSDVGSTGTARTNLAAHNADNLTTGTVPADRLSLWPLLTMDSSVELGWVQQQADGLFQITKNGDSLTNLAANELRSGTVDPARLGSGSSITTKFLRGDSTWQTISGGGDLLAANNLTDLASTNAARTNIGAHNASNLTEGILPDARMPNLTGDVTTSEGAVATTIAANAVALGTDTTGNYVATIADSGASEVTVSGSGSETAAVTLAIASTIARDTEVVAVTNQAQMLIVNAPLTNATGIRAITAQQTNESTLEGFLDLQDLQGAVTDAQVPNTITIDLATLATTATTANAGDSATSFFPSGTVEAARLGSGTTDGTTWLRGDGTWQSTNIFGGSGSQTPWTGDINAAGKSLTNVNNLEVTNTLTIYNLTLTNLGGTGPFLATSNNIVVFTNAPSGSGAPTDADYLVGTANGSLSAEIVVGTSPGGELGGTWASPTIDDSVTVTGWVLGTSTATTPSAGDNDTSLATSAFVTTAVANGTNNSAQTWDTEWDTIAEIETVVGRKFATNNGTMTASTLIIGDGARGITTTTTASGALTFLGTPSSANFASLLTDESGSGVFPLFSLTSLTAGDGVKWSGSGWTNGPITGAGTVTSVGLTAPSGFTVSGSPVTGSGTLAISTPGLVHTNLFAGVATFAGNMLITNTTLPYIKFAVWDGADIQTNALAYDMNNSVSPSGVGWKFVGGSTVFAGAFSGTGAQLTALAAANITAGGTPPALNGLNITNLNYDSPTNTWTVNTALPLGQTNLAVSVGTATVGIPSLANVPSSGSRWGELLVIATGTVTFTNHPSIRLSDGLTSRTITNGTTAVIAPKVWSGFKTNAAIVHFP